MSEAPGGGDLMSSLDALEAAEPLPPEEDLVLRMEAVSKLRGRKKAEKKQAKVAASGVNKSIAKQRPKRKQGGQKKMEV